MKTSPQPISLQGQAYAATILRMPFDFISKRIKAYQEALLSNYNYYENGIDEKQQKLLIRYFRYYRKLSLNLRVLFEERLKFFEHTVPFEVIGAKKIRESQKLLILSYAAQLTIGINQYQKIQIKKIVIHPGRFQNYKGKFVTWNVSSDGTISLSWKDFYRELNNEHMFTPIGLKIMSIIIGLSEELSFKQRIVSFRCSDYFKETNNISRIGEPIFRSYELSDNNYFVSACLLHYFGKPHVLKNHYPKLFHTIDDSLNALLTEDSKKLFNPEEELLLFQ